MRALGQRIGERVDALLEVIERGAARSRMGDVLDALSQRLHFGGKPADGLIGSDVGRQRAQRVNGAIELLQRCRVLLRHDHVDLVRETGDGLVETDKVLSRRQ